LQAVGGMAEWSETQAGLDVMVEADTVDSATVRDPMRLRYHRGDVVSKLMNETEPPMTNERLAELASCSRGTVAGLLSGEKETKDSYVEAMARALGITLAQVDEEVRRLNDEGSPSADQRPRAARTRAEDHNIVLDESLRLGHKIATLPLAARAALTNLVMAFEDAYREKK
jgi:transcriptional regulator with XRE-family HTH domain